MPIKKSELILNPDGSVYHLNLRPEHISKDIIFVGDQNRVEKITSHFDNILFETQKREFKTHTGTYNGKRLTVISTGIGPDNIDIVMNELDALLNIDLKTRQPKAKLGSFNIIRVGTSGAVQRGIPIDSFLMSTFGLDLNGMLHSYRTESIEHPLIENAFIKHTHWSANKAKPLLCGNSYELEQQFDGNHIYKGVTATAGGFYGPQGRILRLPLADEELNNKINSFKFQDLRITNFEMETAAIYGMAKLLGHNALSLNAIIANRADGTFSKNPEQTIERLIEYTLKKIVIL